MGAQVRAILKKVRYRTWSIHNLKRLGMSSEGLFLQRGRPKTEGTGAKLRYEGLDKWLRCQASVLEVHGSNPAMTWLKITSLLSLPYRR